MSAEKADGHLPGAVAVSLEGGQELSTGERRFYRRPFFAAFILGMCNFLAPGLWGAFNSLGGAGQAEPWVVNTANAVTFVLMVVTCLFSGTFVKRLGVKYTIILGTMGFCPYAAGLYVCARQWHNNLADECLTRYCNNIYRTSWTILLGATLCGLTAGIFWMSEAAVALTYPESYNRGRFVGFWLGFRILGQIVGGAINLGFNATRNKAGAVSTSVYRCFIALTAVAPFIGLALPAPERVQRSDGRTVECSIAKSASTLSELQAMATIFFSRQYLLLIPVVAQALYAEAVFFTFQGLWMTVRARALGSFLGGIVALAGGNILGFWLDSGFFSFQKRVRWAFASIMTYHGMLWTWGAIMVTRLNRTRPTYDWVDSGFGEPFTWYLLQIVGFQMNYMFLYFAVNHLAGESDEAKIRYSGLLRATESAVQAVSYGVSSRPAMGRIGGVYINLGLWAISVVPGWLVVRDIA